MTLEDTNPYILTSDIYEILGELRKDLSDEYNLDDMKECKIDLAKIKEKIIFIENWIKEKEMKNTNDNKRQTK